MNKEEKVIVAKSQIDDWIFSINDLMESVGEYGALKAILSELRELKPVQSTGLDELSLADLCGAHHFYSSIAGGRTATINAQHDLIIERIKNKLAEIGFNL